MFNFSYTSPCKIQGTIRVRGRFPWMGRMTDIDGVDWDVKGSYSRGGTIIALACRADFIHPYYTSTAMESFGLVSQSWKPYLVEVIGQGH